MSSKLQISYYDYSKETSPATFEGVDLTAANFDAQNTLMDNLVSATQAITLCTKIKDARRSSETEFAKTQPTSPYAQREAKWLVRYTDTVDPAGDGTKEIPGPDLDLLDTNGAFMDLGSTEGAAFVTAFEAFQRSRLGNTVQVASIEHVGRNN